MNDVRQRTSDSAVRRGISGKDRAGQRARYASTGPCPSKLRLIRPPENRGKYPSFLTAARGGFAIVSNLFFYQRALIALLWLCLLLHYAWPSDRAAIRPTPPALTTRRQLGRSPSQLAA